MKSRINNRKKGDTDMSNKKQNRKGQGGNTFMKNKANTIFKQFRQLSVILSILLLSGCASWFYTPGMSELEELCEKDGGVEVQKVVEVEGFYNDYLDYCYSCYTEIIENKYQFIELSKKKTRAGDILGEELGLWRVYASDRTDPYCTTSIDQKLSRQKNYKPYADFFNGGHCIAAKKVDSLKSKYGYFSNSTVRTVNKTHGSTIDRFLTEVREMATGNIIGKRIDYSLNPWPKSALDYGRTIHCEAVGDFDMGLYNSSIEYAVLKPRLTK